MSNNVSPSSRKSYAAPALSVIGPVATLTLTLKQFGSTDGFTYMGVPIANASA